MIQNNKKLRLGILLDNFYLETWKYHMLKSVTSSEYSSAELVIVNKKQKNDYSGYFDKILSNRKKLGYLAYTRLENRIIQCKPDAFALVDSEKILKNASKIEINSKMSENFDYFEEEDVYKIKEFNLDVIIDCGCRKLSGDILNAAKYGVWSYHHSDDLRLQSGPSGFWETFERMGERGAFLKILTEDPENEIMLYRSFFGCDSHLVKINNNNCFLRSSFFVPRALKKLFTLGEVPFFDALSEENKKLKFYHYPLYTIPSNFQFLKLFMTHVYRMGVDSAKHQFFPDQWMLLYDLHDTISTSFWRFKKMTPPRDRFWADPHVLFRDDMYYIFIEEYPFRKRKGHISLIEMEQSGKYTDPVKVLEEPFHMSYPHIFEHDGTLFMIPETQQAHTINLYECTDFPRVWKHRKILIDSVDALDSTVLFHNNMWWLFTCIAEPQGTEEYNELYLFFSDNLFGHDWQSHPLNPVISDIKRARPAGKILEHNGTLYRPSQCGKPFYGYGIKLNEILTLTEQEYLEREIAFIEPKWDKKIKGIHTLCHENRLTMIDAGYPNFFL